MIQDYLKTSLVFYDDIEKQHRYNDCCQDTTSYHGLTSPRDRFLPFQIRINVDDWFGDIQSVTLYDSNDNAVANLITGYGILNVMWVLSNCFFGNNYTWVIYNGGTLSANLPEGIHYIKITDDAGHAWYSELFTICSMTQVDAYSEEEILLEWTNGAGVLGTFDNFTSSGNDITIADVSSGGPGGVLGGCTSNEILGRTGDEFYFEIDLQKYSGASAWTVLLTEYGNPAIVRSNAVNLNVGSGIYSDVLTTTGNGPYQLVITVNAPAGTTQQASLDFLIFSRIIAGTYDNMIGIEWYNDCDFDDIIYQSVDGWYTKMDAFINRLYFPVRLESPRTETTRDEDERLGTRFVKSIVQKKYYVFKLLVPEFLYNVLQTLQLYANNPRSSVRIFLDNGDVGEVEELNITEEWLEANCYCHLTIEFREDAVVWTNCCDNYALRDESSCS